MQEDKLKGVIESILFASGREVKISELMSALVIRGLYAIIAKVSNAAVDKLGLLLLSNIG